jgi:hypothetical protein
MHKELELDLGAPTDLKFEPRPLPFIDTTLGQIVQAGVFRVGQPLIFVRREAFVEMDEHTRRYARQGEVGGIMLGAFCTAGDAPFVCVSAVLPAGGALSSYGGLAFTPDSLLEIDARREELYPALRPVGWYHSHPSFGIFLSSIDLDSHHTVFKDGPFLAMVLDPIKGTNGVFGWVNGQVAGPLGYWLVAPA